MTDLHIIASCTDRKNLPVPDSLRLRNASAAEIAQRARAWWRQLVTSTAETRTADALYAGEHWSVVLSLSEVARASGFTPNLWVVSAGYGLIPGNALIRPYSATFSRGHVDSVVHDAARRDTAEQLKVWWRTLATYSGPSRSSARSISQLATEQPLSSVLIVASPLYVTAMEDDLTQAASQLQHPERLVIVSSLAPLARGGLAKHWIPSSARHQSRLGGSRLSLHARVAREILQSSRTPYLNARMLLAKYERLIAQSTPLRQYTRKPLTDAEVRSFIREALSQGASSWSASLRMLRAQQLACEQSRFKSLFFQVQGGS